MGTCLFAESNFNLCQLHVILSRVARYENLKIKKIKIKTIKTNSYLGNRFEILLFLYEK